ncbi:MAG: hypothetical protein ACR2JU_13570 [Nocardioidaceae bacterium]
MPMSVNRARRGIEADADQVVKLTAGDLRAELVGSDLRAVRWGRIEVVQRLYMAVRDAPWNTIPGILLEREVVQGQGSFAVTFRQRHQIGEIDLSWTGVVRGSADGVLTYEMSARAEIPFRHSKIGLNIHHGLGPYRHRRYTAATEDGEMVGRLPDDIAPQLVKDGSLTGMFDHFDRIRFDLDGVRANFEFDGDRFELQDHRNWSDANYKTYGTPLSFGFPRDIEAGQQVWQRVTLRLESTAPPSMRSREVTWLELAGSTTLPRIGHTLIDCEPPAQVRAGAVLAVARPDHITVNVRPGTSLTDRLTSVRSLMLAAPTALELIVHLDPAAPEQLIEELITALVDRRDDVARVVILLSAVGFSEFKGATPPKVADAVRGEFRARGIATPVFSGTDQFFNELNRARPDYSGLDGVAFSLNPQVHASDDRSVTQNASTINDIAAFCRRLYPAQQIAVGPVQLLGLDGPYPAGPPTPGGLPPGQDARHGALFGAAWTLSFIEAATRGAVDHVTLFDLTGPRGLALESSGSVGLPVLWLLAQLRGTGDADAVLVDAEGDDDGERCAALAMRGPRGLRVLVANLRDQTLDVRLRLDAPMASVRTLDELTLADTDALTGREPAGAQQPVGGGWLPMLLRPYAVVSVDIANGATPRAATNAAEATTGG